MGTKYKEGILGSLSASYSARGPRQMTGLPNSTTRLCLGMKICFVPSSPCCWLFYSEGFQEVTGNSFLCLCGKRTTS